MSLEILDIIDQAEIYQNILQQHGYPKFYISISMDTLKPGVAGMATISSNIIHRERVIKISKDFLQEFPQEVLTTTLGHELAHHYVFLYHPQAKQAHGPEFRNIMNLLQLNGNTYHQMKLENGPQLNTRIKTRYIYKTIISGYEVKLTKKQHMNNQNYRYKGEQLSYTGKVITYK